MATDSSGNPRCQSERRRTLGASGAALAATLFSLSASAQLPSDSSAWLAHDEFVCATQSPDWQGRYTTLATPAPDGVPLYFYQDPPYVTADYQGSVVLRNFTVVGDRPMMRVYYAQGSRWEFDEFPRVTTRSVRGVLVSIFEPAWAMSDLLDRANAGISVFWDNQGNIATFVFGGDAIPAPGQFPPNGLPILIRSGPKNVRPVAITRMSDTVQFSSHVVNLVVPGFGDGRLLDDDAAGFDIHEIARKFYQSFDDSYETLVVIPEARHFRTPSGFHRVVQNRIEGIGLSVFDSARDYGSSGVLQGVEYLSVINNIGIKHEQAHQWGDYFNWSRIGDITVTDTAHTPVWADRETPLPGRVAWWLRIGHNSNEWRTVRAAFPHVFSPMMLYAMGRLPKEQVPSIVLFDNQQQAFGAPGLAAQGTFKTKTVFDAVGVHGERRGPAVGSSLSRANIVVSTRGLISPQEMAFWTHYVQRSEDPNGTGVQGYSDDGSFDRATGVDLRSDIRPKGFAALPGDRMVDDKAFSVDDIAGVKLEAEVTGRLGAGGSLTLRGEVTAPTFSGSETLTVSWRSYQSSVDVNEQTVTVGASRRFDVTLPAPAASKGAYGLRFELSRARRITTLAPIIVE